MFGGVMYFCLNDFANFGEIDSSSSLTCFAAGRGRSAPWNRSTDWKKLSGSFLRNSWPDNLKVKKS